MNKNSSNDTDYSVLFSRTDMYSFSHILLSLIGSTTRNVSEIMKFIVIIYQIVFLLMFHVSFGYGIT